MCQVRNRIWYSVRHDRETLEKALFNRGLTLRALKRFDKAVLSFDAALKIRPDYTDAFFFVETLLELKRFEQALASFDWALKVRPDPAERSPILEPPCTS